MFGMGASNYDSLKVAECLVVELVTRMNGSSFCPNHGPPSPSPFARAAGRSGRQTPGREGRSTQRTRQVRLRRARQASFRTVRRDSMGGGVAGRRFASPSTSTATPRQRPPPPRAAAGRCEGSRGVADGGGSGGTPRPRRHRAESPRCRADVAADSAGYIFI